MDKTTFFTWKYMIPAFIFASANGLIFTYVQDWLYRFLAILALRWGLFFYSMIINGMADKETFKGPVGKSLTQMAYKTTLSSLVLALSVIGIVASGLFGSGSLFTVSGWWFNVNYGYLLIWFMLYLGVELIANLMTRE